MFRCRRERLHLSSKSAYPIAQTTGLTRLQNQFSGDSTQIYGCFCNNYPSDAATCATCLNDNNAAALGSLLTSTQTACPQAIQSCFFACSFDTCASSDIACQCELQLSNQNAQS